jgi:hypothetical protein
VGAGVIPAGAMVRSACGRMKLMVVAFVFGVVLVRGP